MKFIINDAEWTIKMIDNYTMIGIARDTGIFGRTEFETQEILLRKDTANVIRTLKHELMHVWLWEYGHDQHNDNVYDCEDICEIVASSNNFINEIVEKFKKEVEK